ncbi:MAG: hypothetical protein QJR00_01025 [Bacillota bacterium]|nr:hypothetical protein [Bacillota bacterium]
MTWNEAVEGFLGRRSCPLCGQAGWDEICPSCLARYAHPSWTPCPRCHIPSPAQATPGGLCSDCAGSSFPWSRRFSLAPYEEPWITLLRRFKGGETFLARPLGKTLARALPWAELGPFVAVTWVPPDPQRHRRRGYHGAELLARSLARGRLVALPLLRKEGTTPPQHFLGRLGRTQADLSFRPLPGAPMPRGRLLLVDDVWTTGTTLSQAAAALLEGGARAVVGITLCQVTGGR